MKRTSFVSTSENAVFKGNLYASSALGLLSVLGAINTSYSKASFNSAKWKGLLVGLIPHVAVLLLYFFVIGRVLYWLRIVYLLVYLPNWLNIAVQYVLCCGIVHFVIKALLKKRIIKLPQETH